MLDETKASPHENVPDQYVAWGHNKDLKLFTRQGAASGSNSSNTKKSSSTTALGVSKKAVSKSNSKKQTVRKTNGAKTFASWGARQVCELVRSIGPAFEGPAVAIEENGIDGRFFQGMLARNDEDLTTKIADGGLGFTRLQLKRVMAEIEQHKYGSKESTKSFPQSTLTKPVTTPQFKSFKSYTFPHGESSKVHGQSSKVS